MANMKNKVIAMLMALVLAASLMSVGAFAAEEGSSADSNANPATVEENKTDETAKTDETDKTDETVKPDENAKTDETVKTDEAQTPTMLTAQPELAVSAITPTITYTDLVPAVHPEITNTNTFTNALGVTAGKAQDVTDSMTLPGTDAAVTANVKFGTSAYTFNGWIINGTTYPAGSVLTVDASDSTICIDGTDTDSTAITAAASWTYEAKVRFFLRLDGTTPDTKDSVAGRASNNYTSYLWEATIVNPTVATGDDSVRAFTIKDIKLADGKEVGASADDKTALTDLKKNITVNLWDSAAGKFVTKTVTAADIISGAAVSAAKDTDAYTINYYVLKHESDGWHIDGNITFCQYASVSYEFDGTVPSSAVLPKGGMVQLGTGYTVDKTYTAGDTVKDSAGTYTFGGWKLSGSDTDYTGTTQVMGGSSVTYVGVWTFVAAPVVTPAASTTPASPETPSVPSAGSTSSDTASDSNTNDSSAADTNSDTAANADIADTDVPLSAVPAAAAPVETPATEEIADEETPLSEVPDEAVPMAQAPKTGDSMAVWMALTGISGTVLAGAVLLSLKRRNGAAD